MISGGLKSNFAAVEEHVTTLYKGNWTSMTYCGILNFK